jgi:hypothetical protein
VDETPRFSARISATPLANALAVVVKASMLALERWSGVKKIRYQFIMHMYNQVYVHNQVKGRYTLGGSALHINILKFALKWRNEN